MKSSYPALQGAVTVAIAWISARLGVLAAKAEAIAHPDDPALELGLESTDVAGILTELAARVKALEEGGSNG